MRAPSAVLAVTFYLCLSTAAPIFTVDGPLIGAEGPRYEVEGATLPGQEGPGIHLIDGTEPWRPEAENPPVLAPEEGPLPEDEDPSDSNEIPVYREPGRNPDIDPSRRHGGFWDGFHPETDPKVPTDKPARTRVYYTTKYTKGGLNNKGGKRNIAVDLEGVNGDLIVEKMGEWSGNTFEAKFSDKDHNIIIVSAVIPVGTVNEAIEANKLAKNFIQSNLKKVGPKP